MEAVSVIPPSGGSVVAVTENVATKDPAGTFTDAGTASASLVLEIPTVLPPPAAASLSVTVQVAALPALTVVGLQASDETTACATRIKVVVCKLPFNVAVMTALWFAVSVPATATKLAELAPAGTFTDAGTASSALLSESVTIVLKEAV